MPFACSICEQESTRICAFCTKDACDNHLCQHCGGCSDCCECEVPLDEPAGHPQAMEVNDASPAADEAVPDHAADPEPATASPDPIAQSETTLPAPAEPPSGLPTPEV